MKKNRFFSKEYLDALNESYGAQYLALDPLKYVRGFTRKEDQEIIGLVAAALSYGIVEQIFKSIDFILARVESKPFEFVKQFDPKKDSKRFEGFVHRFNRGRDVACLFWWLRQIYEKNAFMEDFFLEGYHPADKSIRPALTFFVERIVNFDSAGLYGTEKLPQKARVRFFLPHPKLGGGCKRLNMFLRWMVRPNDGKDLGLWKKISPSKLVIPLDTHIIKCVKKMGLTRRKTADWKMAEEITQKLKKLDPNDPLKYDFSLCRLGMMAHWPEKRQNYLMELKHV